LDYIGTVKLVNYIRSEVKVGNKRPNWSTADFFEDDKYLKPVLEDDAILYSLDDVADIEEGGKLNGDQQNSQAEVEELREELGRLQNQFTAYREQVQKALDKQIIAENIGASTSLNGTSKIASSPDPRKGKADDLEAGYFSSYSYNAIHESMLKDTIRTDAYRDFIYDNKHLFAGKVVLDVGCGTGILSMFCARAGAKKVIAVDNSDIIDKARQNVFENGFQDVITCVRGKIEEVTMPVAKVDVIVSEWMGYCLLYESMLDSVIYARDKYLTPGGLMVPSHAKLRIAPIADSELVTSHVDFWNYIYGFTMTGMLENVHDEALIRSVEPSDLAAESDAFLELDLHNASTRDLTFFNNFEISWSKDGDEQLQGFVIWFDMYFGRSPTESVPQDMTPEQAVRKGMTAFTTGPDAIQTHWQQGALLIKKPFVTLRKGDTLTGHIGYQRMENQERSVDIEVRWKAPSMSGESRQVWSLN
jgi:protein arginine N-methyltransferase 3